MRVATYWSTEDVLALDNSLSEDQANAVLLLACVSESDAEAGVNWEVLGYWIDHVKENPDSVGRVLEQYGDHLELAA